MVHHPPIYQGLGQGREGLENTAPDVLQPTNLITLTWIMPMVFTVTIPDHMLTRYHFMEMGVDMRCDLGVTLSDMPGGDTLVAHKVVTFNDTEGGVTVTHTQGDDTQ